MVKVFVVADLPPTSSSDQYQFSVFRDLYEQWILPPLQEREASIRVDPPWQGAETPGDSASPRELILQVFIAVVRMLCDVLNANVLNPLFVSSSRKG